MAQRACKRRVRFQPLPPAPFPASSPAFTAPFRSLSLNVFADFPGSSNRRFKGVCDLPYPPALVFSVLSDNARRCVWDRNIASLEATVLQTSPHPATLLRSCTKGMLGISSRDFLDVSVELRFPDGPSPPAPGTGFSAPAGSLVVAGVGLEADAAYPEGLLGTVRGFNSPGSGWVFEALPGGSSTRVHYLIHVDLRGWIPSALVNSSLAKNYVDFFTDLLEAIKLTKGVSE